MAGDSSSRIPDGRTLPGDGPAPPDPLRKLAQILQRARPSAGTAPRLAALSDDEITELPRLYRYAASEVARLEAGGADPHRAAWARSLFSRCHGLLFPGDGPRRGSLLGRLARFYAVRVPRAIRREAKLVGWILMTLYGLATISFVAVSRDLDLAPSLLSAEVVETEIAQLEEAADGAPFRGNFTFGLRESPSTAGFLMLHNIGIGVLFFAAGLIPPIFLLLLATNSLMLGTYTAVAGHFGQAGAISSILWCHGVLEIQAIVLAGAAGLVLLRGWVRPGPYTRRYALRRESAHALELVAAIVPMLVGAGLIEAFISPHAPMGVRTATAIATGCGLIAWVALGGRKTARA